MKQRIYNTLNFLGTYYNTVQLSLMLSFIIIAILSKIPTFFYFLYPTLSYIIHFVCKGFNEGKFRNISIIVYELLYCNISTYMILRRIEISTGRKINILVKITVYIFINVTFAGIVFCIRETKKKNHNESFSIKRLLDQKQSSKNDYSVNICNDKETNSPVYISTRDRFLHSLILGPTGSGKTSRMMAKMIFSDLQTDAGLTLFEPKDDLAEKLYAMCRYINDHGGNKEFIYFNPTLPDCPYFNILEGKEDEVIETITTTFNMLDSDSSTYFKGTNNNLLRKAIMVLKRIEAVYTDPVTGISSQPATLIRLSDILNNTSNKGKNMVHTLETLPCISDSEKSQNQETVAWFLNDYYSDKSKSYNDSSGVRQQVSNLIQNKYLRRILNPENGKSGFNFDEFIEKGKVIIVSTAQGTLRELGSYLGLFLILTYQSAIFRRKGNEHTRKPQMFYCDEFQKYANPSMEDLFTEGRSYKVSMNVATQSREQVMLGSGSSDGKRFLSVISANCRNVILFPGISSVDALYYSKEFGEELVQNVRHGTSKTNSSIFGRSSSSESVQTSEQYQSRYTVGDIIYKNEDEITYKIMENNNVKVARDGITSYLDKKINDELDKYVERFKEEQLLKLKESEEKENKQRQSVYTEYIRKNGNSLPDGYSVNGENRGQCTPGINSVFTPGNPSN